ncbi:uncharacterized protein Gasu_60130 [Galdieria sulphuraria]|uniref:JmjC domain-containing protein n=1 Tax=Galdieria sulphuraria TaxID=130081 RepID=M2XRR1_GALSU|nr:uncharacterized protein Gasu_60130 [Galdieria sulphuraria]EME26338.1 hypothetical protein Gasu_60130 [Galdieria sulphuraria]|eukprot:XP_005702858.1 hypothetical protein Gasu_60130 [Galdieria sulphuraria]
MKKQRRESSVSSSYKTKLSKSSYWNASFQVPAHPLGIKPLGNLWTTSSYSVDSIGREKSLGFFSILSDEWLLDLLYYLDGCSAAMLSCCSKYLYAFCSYNELWRERTLRDFTHYNFESSWKNTYKKAVVREKEQYVDDHSCCPLIRCDKVYSDVLYRTWCTVYFHFPSYASWWKRDNIPRLHTKDLDVDTFIQQFEKQNMPLVIQGVVTQWPAYHKWNRSYFIQHCNDFAWTVGPTQMTMQEYIHYMETNVDINPLYLFEKRFQQLPLALDYQVPKYFKNRDWFSLVEKYYNKRPDHSWLIYGPPRSGSRFHIDPNQTCAWNAVIKGSKKWVLFPPPSQAPSPPGVFPNEDYSEVTSPASLIEWFTNFYEEAKKRKDIIECVVKSGELLFIPRGWWHIVLNLEESIAITENYVSESNISHVLEFLQSKPHQISGWDDDQDLQSLLIDVIQRERLNLPTQDKRKLSTGEK